MKQQERMYQLAEAWENNSQTKNEFLADKEVSTSKFNYWLKKYRDRQAAMQPAPQSQNCPGNFSAFDLHEVMAGKEQEKIMELTTPSGIRIIIYN
jgi:predicted acetyltransferase